MFISSFIQGGLEAAMDRYGIAVVIVLVLAIAFLFEAPVVSNPGLCRDGALCIPGRYQSVTRYLFGFGAETSYGHYHFWVMH